MMPSMGSITPWITHGRGDTILYENHIFFNRERVFRDHFPVEQGVRKSIGNTITQRLGHNYRFFQICSCFCFIVFLLFREVSTPKRPWLIL